jgi:hypothetical protein
MIWPEDFWDIISETQQCSRTTSRERLRLVKRINDTGHRNIGDNLRRARRADPEFFSPALTLTSARQETSTVADDPTKKLQSVLKEKIVSEMPTMT